MALEVGLESMLRRSDGTLLWPSSAIMTPAKVLVGASTPTLPCLHYSSVIVSTSGGSVTVPVTTYVGAGPTAAPMLGAVVGAGSLREGTIAPGEIVTILGAGIGGAPAGLKPGGEEDEGSS